MFAARMRQYETIITINILLCIEIHSAANFKQTLCTFAATKKSLVRVSTTKLECSENNTDLTLLILVQQRPVTNFSINIIACKKLYRMCP